ncbi:MAG: hypothetical protein HC903_18050 [Methylacidiphilales bacterium]|nr:hypothetical protein [Candidatus Methylacidiphilales bacterium]
MPLALSSAYRVFGCCDEIAIAISCRLGVSECETQHKRRRKGINPHIF